jgi:NADH-quinone oxidoreductase subunit J
MLVEIVTLIGVRAKLAAEFTATPASGDVPNTVWLARTLFTDFVLPFEVAAVILTVAVVAAVMLTLRHRGGVRQQDPSWQSSIRAADRVRLVRMEPVRAPQAPVDPNGGEA